MNFFFHPEARKELISAVKYYNECSSGLGSIFLEEVNAAINRIMQFPKFWSKLSKNTRRCLTHRFPYGIIYQETGNGILIVAIMHMKRESSYWKDRLE